MSERRQYAPLVWVDIRANCPHRRQPLQADFNKNVKVIQFPPTNRYAMQSKM